MGMKHETLDVLFVRFRVQRDPRALAAVFDRTSPHLYRVARKLASPGGDAEDLVQATFLQAIEAAESYDAARPLEPWLLGILIHQAQAARRRERRTLDIGRVDRGSQAAPDDVVLKSELAGAVRTAVESLPAAYREVVEPRLLGERAIDVAARLDRSPATVRKQFHRALLLMRRCIPQGLAGLLLSLSPLRRALASVRAEVLKAAGSSTSSSLVSSAGIAQLALLMVLVVGGGLVLVRSRVGATEADPPAAGQPVAQAAVPAQDASGKARKPDTVRQELDPASSEAGGTIPAELRRTFSGRVLDEDGKPVDGASIEFLAKWNPLTPAPQLADVDGTIVASGMTAADGAFALALRGSGCLLDTGLLVIRKQGLSTARVRVPCTLRQCTVEDVVLHPQRRIEMTVTDGEGAPLAGAAAAVWDVTDLDRLSFGRRDPMIGSILRMHIGSGTGRSIVEGQADANGRIELSLPEASDDVGFLLCVRSSKGPGLLFEVGGDAYPDRVSLPPIDWISGVVEDADGQPLSEVEVICSGVPMATGLAKLSGGASSIGSQPGNPTSSLAADSALSDEQGRFTIAQLRGEQSSLSFWKKGYRTVTAPVDEVRGSEWTVRMLPAPAIQVQVVAANGEQVISEARIETLLETSLPFPVRVPIGDGCGVSTRSEGSGRFRVLMERRPGPAEGRLLLRVCAAGFAPQTLPIPGDTARGMTIRMERGNRIRGRLTTQGGRPLAGAVVRVQEVTKGDPRIVRSARSAIDGSFELSNLPEGTFRVGTFVEGYRPFVSDRMELFLDEDIEMPIELPAAAELEGQVVSKHPRLAPPFQVRASQKDLERRQEGLQGLEFELMAGGWGNYGPDWDLSTVTDHEGRFALRTCPEGEYEWCVLETSDLNPPDRADAATGLVRELMRDGWSSSDEILARAKVVLKGGETEILELEVGEESPGTASLTGWISGRLPDFRYQAHAGAVTVTVDDSGAFRLEDLEPGSTQLSILAWRPAVLESAFEVASENVELPPGSIESIQLDLAFHTVIRIEIRDRESGKRLTNAAFSLSQENRRQRYQAMTPVGVVSGRYRLEAWSPEHAWAGQNLEIVAGRTPALVEIPLTRVDPWQTRLGTRLVDLQGEPIRDAELCLKLGTRSLISGLGDSPTQTKTNSQGVIQKDLLVEPGRYPATLVRPGISGFEFELDLTRPSKQIVVPLPMFPRARVLVVDAGSGTPLDGDDLAVLLEVVGLEAKEPGARLSWFESGSEVSFQPGRSAMVVRAQGYRPILRFVDLPMGDSNREIRFALARLQDWPESHRTRVVNEDGELVTNRVCILREVDGINLYREIDGRTSDLFSGFWGAIIDEHGETDLREIPAGRYRLSNGPRGEDPIDSWATIEESRMTTLVIHRETR